MKEAFFSKCPFARQIKSVCCVFEKKKRFCVADLYHFLYPRASLLSIDLTASEQSNTSAEKA
jgi:hypothetical protein